MGWCEKHRGGLTAESVQFTTLMSQRRKKNLMISTRVAQKTFDNIHYVFIRIIITKRWSSISIYANNHQFDTFIRELGTGGTSLAPERLPLKLTEAFPECRSCRAHRAVWPHSLWHWLWEGPRQRHGQALWLIITETQFFGKWVLDHS